MWRMFEKTIKDKIEEISVKYPNPKLMSLFAKQLCEETRNLMPQFEQQLCEQTEHINIVRFFAVYEEYDIQYKRWVRHEISDAELDQEWLQLVGRAQLELLLVKKGALHLLMEFCRPGADWLPQSKFNNPAPPPQDCKIYNVNTSSTISLFSFLHPSVGSRLAADVSLIRGRGAPCAATRRDASERWLGVWRRDLGPHLVAYVKRGEPKSNCGKNKASSC